MTVENVSTRRTMPATTIALGEAGIAIRGPSGSGKSSLALALIAAAGPNAFARLVADDVTRIDLRGGRIIARALPSVAGLIERRGLGITPVAATAAVVLRLIVDCLGEQPPRLPEPDMLVTRINGIMLPRIAVSGQPRDVDLVRAALDLMFSGRSG